MTAPARGSRLALLALLVLLGALLVVPAVTPTASADPAPAGRIAGKVTGAGGLILPGVTEVYVLVWNADASGWSADGPRVFADDQGHYEATGLVAGTYRLMFEPQGVDWLSDGCNALTVGPGSDRAALATGAARSAALIAS